jgi:hypothetical protein
MGEPQTALGTPATASWCLSDAYVGV